MRDILFRGKRIDNGEWVLGWYEPPVEWDGHKFGTTIAYICEEGYLEDAEVDPSTVGQYTGLTDKSGTKIFEGDIVEDASIGLLGDVVFSVVGVPSFGINDVHDGLQYHDGFWSDLEIIGNIHDNPELMEVHNE